MLVHDLPYLIYLSIVVDYEKNLEINLKFNGTRKESATSNIPKQSYFELILHKFE